MFFFVWGTAELYAKCPKLYKSIHHFPYCSSNLLIFKGYSGFVSVFFLSSHPEHTCIYIELDMICVAFFKSVYFRDNTGVYSITF